MGVKRAWQHSQTIQGVAEAAAATLQGATAEDRAEGEEVIQAALAGTAQGSSRRVLAAKQRLIERKLQEVYPALLKIERNWKLEQDAWTLDNELKPVIRAQLEKQISGDESDEEVSQLVRKLTRRAVGIR